MNYFIRLMMVSFVVSALAFAGEVTTDSNDQNRDVARSQTKYQQNPQGEQAPNLAANTYPTNSAMVTTNNWDLPMTRLNVGPSLNLISGIDGVGIGIDVDVLFRVNHDTPLYLGFDFGYHQWSPDPLNAESTANLSKAFEYQPSSTAATLASAKLLDFKVRRLQMLPTLIYRFEFDSMLHPFLGFSAGPTLYGFTIGAKAPFSSVISDETGSKFKLEVLSRIGLEIDFNHDLSVVLDPRVGIAGIESKFFIAPSIALSIGM